MGSHGARITLLATATLLACQREAPAPPPSPPTPPPSDAAPVDATPGLGWASADAITIKDNWSALGCGYFFDLTLRRQGDVFADPVSRWRPWPVELPAGAIARLEAAAVRALAAHHPPPPYPNPHPGPYAHDPVQGEIVFITGTTVDRLHYHDERRILLLDRDGVTTPLDPPDPQGGQARPMWDAYVHLLYEDLGNRGTGNRCP